MKNIQVIDGADNCAYAVYQISEENFAVIFPKEDQDIEFAEDLFERIGEPSALSVLTPMWSNRIEKRDVSGLHGTLFYQMSFKKKFYPNKKESDLDDAELQKRLI